MPKDKCVLFTSTKVILLNGQSRKVKFFTYQLILGMEMYTFLNWCHYFAIKMDRLHLAFFVCKHIKKFVEYSFSSFYSFFSLVFKNFIKKNWKKVAFYIWHFNASCILYNIIATIMTFEKKQFLFFFIQKSISII